MTPVLISSKGDLLVNLQKVESYLNSEASMDDAEIMSGYIQRGHNFVAYKVRDVFHFAPSKFIGYRRNSLSKHEIFLDKHIITGTETDKRLNKLLGAYNFDEKLEEAYISYCNLLGVSLHLNRQRKYWVIDEDIVTPTGINTYEEGDVKVREHLVRERNQQVVAEAKKLFKQKYGYLFCEVCGFDFSKVYGKHGEDYIQAHHAIPLALHDKKHKITPTEFNMLCANCHCMIHRPENGEILTIDRLKEIINEK